MTSDGGGAIAGVVGARGCTFMGLGTHGRARIAQRPKGRPMLLKKLFLASASVLMLALAFHLGASTAGAQSGLLRVLGVGPSGPFVQVGGSVYVLDLRGTFGAPGSWRNASDIVPLWLVQPSDIALLTGSTGGSREAGCCITSSGAAYQTDGYSWVQIASVPGGATPARTQSWGSVKVQQR